MKNYGSVTFRSTMSVRVIRRDLSNMNLVCLTVGKLPLPILAESAFEFGNKLNDMSVGKRVICGVDLEDSELVKNLFVVREEEDVTMANIFLGFREEKNSYNQISDLLGSFY